MQVRKTAIDGCLIIEPVVHGDDRGFFMETFSARRYADLAGIDLAFVQDNHSRSTKGVLRGLHFQKTKLQGKLVRVTRGEAFDVAVDLRQGSPTFGQWQGVVLNENNKQQLWIPPGFAHGFLVMSEICDLEYKCTEYYDADDEVVIAWDDPELGIQWPKGFEYQLSEKDRNAGSFEDFKAWLG